MIGIKDQEELFELISRYLEKDIECYAIGGTAMMFYGYKNATKDIDLVFKTKKEMELFIDAIIKLGYKERSLKGVYLENKLNLNSKPKMFTRGDERFDLFLKDIFGFKITERVLNSFYSRHDFITKKELIIKVLAKEYIILLKSLTNREKDFEDIKSIIDQDKKVNWDKIIDEAVDQMETNGWALIDLEETMQKLKKITFISSKYFKRIYGGEKKQ